MNMKNRIRIIAILMLVLGLSIAWAGGEKETEQAPGSAPEGIQVPAGEVELDMWFQDWSGGVKWHQEFIGVFMKKYPNIKINLIPIPFEELNTKLIPSIAQGNEADIMYGYSDWIENLDVSKLFLRLSPDLYTMEAFKQAVSPASLKPGTGKDGELYVFSQLTGGNGFGFCIHTDLFKEAGIDPASVKTWDDLKKAAKALTVYNDDGSIQRSGILLNQPIGVANVFFDLIVAQGARDKLYNRETGEWNFNIPEAKRAMELLYSFVDDKTMDVHVGDVFTAFPNKLGAMIVGGPWTVGSFGTDYPELDLDYLVIPEFQGNKRVVSQIQWASFMLSKRLKGDKKNAAMLFLKEMIENPEYFNIPYENGYWFGVSANKDYLAYAKNLLDEGTASKNIEIAHRVGTSYLAAIDTLDFRVVATDLLRNIITPEMQKVWLGDQTIDGMLAYLTKYVTNKEQEAMD